MGFILRFLPGLSGILPALLNPWVLLALGIAAGACFLGGMHAQTIIFEAAQKRGQDAAIEDAAKLLSAQRAQNAELSNKLNQERSAREDDKRSFAEQLSKVPTTSLTDVECPPGRPAGEAGPVAPADGSPRDNGNSCRLSVVGMRLWNVGLALGVDEAHRGQFADDANKAAGSVEINAALANVGDNAALLGECRDRELAWQVKGCQIGLWEGPPCPDRLKEWMERSP